MQIKHDEIHVWSVDLIRATEQENKNYQFLSDHERERADRFRFPIHRKRFIAAHGVLRRVLSSYLKIAEKDITFAFTEHKKPYLQLPRDTHLQFNLSHSADLAVFAITLDHAIGIDTEKMENMENMENVEKEALAKRFFSHEENAALARLSSQEKTVAFYRIWSRKEALIKATGLGLSLALSSFTVTATDEPETILLHDETWSLLSMPIHPDFQTALATNHPIKKICYFNFTQHGM